MVELFKYKRVAFSRGKQREFLLAAERKLNLSNEKFAESLKITSRTLTDWKREKFLMSMGAAKIILRKTKNKMPGNTSIRNHFWYVYKGAKIGGAAVYKKYGKIGGDPEYRKKKWREWWEKEGKYKISAFPNMPKPIKKPAFSKELAEFIGIMLGDGGISKYQVAVTLCSKDEKVYSNFVEKLIKKLFNVPVAVLRREENSTIDLVVSRIGLVRFCVERLGLKQGNKIRHRVDIPKWIKNNKSYSIACTRGLIDTDGTIFRHRYNVNGKLYSYKKLSFTSRSKPLKLSVFGILKKIGLKARLSGLYDVRIDSQGDVKKYFESVNSHNQKHLLRYKK